MVVDIRKKKQEGESVIQPLIERAEAYGALRKLTDDIAGEADMGDLLAKQDKEQIEMV